MSKVKIRYCGGETAMVPVIVVSILDILFSSIGIVVLGYIAFMLNKPEDLERVVHRIDPERTGNLANFIQLSSGEQIMTLTIPLVSSCLGFVMGFILFISGLKKYLTALRIWFILTMIFMTIQITIFITQITGGRNTALFIVPGLVEYAFRVYALYVVKCLMKEINAVKEDDASDDTVVVEAEGE